MELTLFMTFKEKVKTSENLILIKFNYDDDFED